MAPNLRWWMVAAATIAVALVVLVAALALASALRRDDDVALDRPPTSTTLDPAIGGLPPPATGGSIPTIPVVPGAAGGPISIVPVTPPTGPPPAAGPSPSRSTPTTRRVSTPATVNEPVGAGGVPTPTTGQSTTTTTSRPKSRCAINEVQVSPDPVVRNRDGTLSEAVVITFRAANDGCAREMHVRVNDPPRNARATLSTGVYTARITPQSDLWSIGEHPFNIVVRDGDTTNDGSISVVERASPA